LQAEKANLQHLLAQEGKNVSETQEELSQCQQQHAQAHLQAQHIIVTLQAENANLQQLLDQEGTKVSQTKEDLSQSTHKNKQAQLIIVTLQAEKASLQQLLSQEAINVSQTQEELSQCQQQLQLSSLQKNEQGTHNLPYKHAEM
jgi:hypothetical protein